MAKLLEMPKLSPTMEEGVLTTWHKKEGDSVAVDDLLADVETDKATMEFRSFDAGTLLRLLVPAGATVRLGQPVAIMGQPGENVDALAAQAGGAVKAAPPAPPQQAPAQAELPASAAAPQVPQSPPQAAAQVAPQVWSAPQGSVLTRTERDGQAPAATPPKGSDGALASPRVRRAALEMGVNLQGKSGTGPHGRIQLEDLAQLREQGLVRTSETAVARVADTGPARPASEAKALSPMRKTIARRLTESKQTVPHFYLQIDVDAGPVWAFRETVNAELAKEKRSGDAPPVKVSLNDFLIKASALALRRVPECNASFSPEAILYHQRVDISVAVAVQDGLVTPVVRDADRLSIVEISERVRDLAGRARAKKLKPEEMADGTFSISNLGMFGIDQFAAVINPPEGAILAVGQVRDEPVVRDGAVVAGKRLALTLSCDHRVVDGAVGAAFLAELRALLATPMRILSG
jgi:pyruvate dehydrogenase E2 component (dihydrolipoamide acetyltransferase)